LGGAREESEGVEEDGGGRFDPCIGETAERDVFDVGEVGKAVLFESCIFDAVESDD
jgi:hypothetical protein